MATRKVSNTHTETWISVASGEPRAVHVTIDEDTGMASLDAGVLTTVMTMARWSQTIGPHRQDIPLLHQTVIPITPAEEATQ